MRRNFSISMLLIKMLEMKRKGRLELVVVVLAVCGILIFNEL